MKTGDRIYSPALQNHQLLFQQGIMQCWCSGGFSTDFRLDKSCGFGRAALQTSFPPLSHPQHLNFPFFSWSFPRSAAFHLILGPLRSSLHPAPRSKKTESSQRAEAKSLAIPAFLSAFKSPFLLISRADCQFWQLVSQDLLSQAMLNLLGEGSCMTVTRNICKCL